MSEEPQVHQSFGSVLLSVLITLIIVGCAGFVFYSITQQQQPQQDAIQQKLNELKAEVDTNKELKDKILELEEKISTLQGAEDPNSSENIEISTEDWIDYSNDFFNISMKYPSEFELCMNDECEENLKDIEADYWEITNPEDNSSITIYPRINKLNQLAIEFGQKMFLANTQNGDAIQGTDAIGIFNEQLAFQFDVASYFMESSVILDENYYLTVDTDADITQLEFEAPHRIIYFDYDGFIYRIIYTADNPTIEKILEEITLTSIEKTENE